MLALMYSAALCLELGVNCADCFQESIESETSRGSESVRQTLSILQEKLKDVRIQWAADDSESRLPYINSYSLIKRASNSFRASSHGIDIKVSRCHTIGVKLSKHWSIDWRLNGSFLTLYPFYFLDSDLDYSFLNKISSFNLCKLDLQR